MKYITEHKGSKVVIYEVVKDFNLILFTPGVLLELCPSDINTYDLTLTDVSHAMVCYFSYFSGYAANSCVTTEKYFAICAL